MSPKRIFPSGAAAAAVLAMGMTFALPANAADKGTSPDATARKGAATATSRMATTEERMQYCTQRALRTENAIGSLGPESPGGKALMQSRVKQAQGLCMEGQVAEANDILMDQIGRASCRERVCQYV